MPDGILQGDSLTSEAYSKSRQVRSCDASLCLASSSRVNEWASERVSERARERARVCASCSCECMCLCACVCVCVYVCVCMCVCMGE
jgi:hypothetical protein